MSVRRFPIPDISVPSSRGLVVQILDHVDHVMAQGGVVYLHCWGGVGRTGTIVGCWLSRHGYKGRAAVDRVQELWVHRAKSGRKPLSPETPEQVEYVVNWDESASISVLYRYTGAMMGLAAGDAVGTTLEFKPPGTYLPIDDMIGGGPFGLKAGEWTDDTSMALCLAESLIRCKGGKGTSVAY